MKQSMIILLSVAVLLSVTTAAWAEDEEIEAVKDIEEAIISAMFDAFYEKEKLTTKRVLESLRQAVPLSKTMSEDIDELRKWADGRARAATSAEVAKEPGMDRRKLEI